MKGCDVGNGELLSSSNLMFGLQSQSFVWKDGMCTIGNTGVGHEAEGGEDGLSASIATGKGVGPEEANRTVDVFIFEIRVTGFQEVVDILLVC